MNDINIVSFFTQPLQIFQQFSNGLSKNHDQEKKNRRRTMFLTSLPPEGSRMKELPKPLFMLAHL